MREVSTMELINDVKDNPDYESQALRLADVLEERINGCDRLLKTQCSDGNWNYDSYGHGMANGMILVLTLIKGEDPKYLDAPKEWLRDKSKNLKPVEVSQ